MTRIALADRPWLPLHSVLSVGPVTTPTVAEVRAGLRRVAEAFPDHPLVCRIDREQMRWRRVPTAELDRHLETVVTQDGDAHAIDTGSLERRLPQLLDERSPVLPLEIIVGSRSLTIVVSHALGDVRADLALLERLLRAGREPAALVDLVGPSSDRSTLKALVDFYGRKPTHVVDTLRADRPAPRSPPAPPTTRARDRGAMAACPALVYRVVDRATWSAVRAWRTRRFPDASVAAVVFSLTCTAFASSGLGVDSSGFYLLVDNRRYLRGPPPLSGNLAKSVYVRPDDVSDPNAVHRTIRETVASGRPLASAAYSAVSSQRQRRQQRRTGRSTGWAPSDDVELSLTHVSRPASLASLPWLGGDRQRWFAGCGNTGSKRGITVFSMNLHGELHLSVCFDPDRIDPDRVRRALSLLQAGPPP